MDDPKPNEVWRTRSGELVLIVTGPSQYRDIDGVTPPGAMWFPAVFNRKQDGNGWGLLTLCFLPYKGWHVSEIWERLLEKTDVTATQFITDTLRQMADKQPEHAYGAQRREEGS